MADSDNKEGITLKGPWFGAFCTFLLVVVIIAYAVGVVLTKAELIPWTLLAFFAAVISWCVFAGLRAFYRWSSRGFKAKPKVW